jgi:hypothetical protein
MDTIAHATFSITWDPKERFATMLLCGTDLGGEDARAIIEALQERIATGGGWGAGHIRVLGSATDVVTTSAPWRALWARFFREHARTMSMAIVVGSPINRIMIHMYAIGTGTRVKAFAREEEARAWLLGGDG